MNPIQLTHAVHRRCTCGRLLAIQSGGALHIKRGDIHAVVRGALWLRCSRCERETSLDSNRS